jgi:hypothetical protein
MLSAHCFGAGSGNVQLVIAADVANYDLFAHAGSPAGVVNVQLTINSGVVVYSNSTGTPALFQSAPFAAGSTVTLINNGTICGRGGDGGKGQDGPFAEPGGTPGNPGFDAGDAITLQNDWTIDNSNGYIFGGGGGGAGGYSAYSSGNGDGGGGGGGGQGRVNSNAGAGGAKGALSGSAGVQGSPGNFAGPGAGGPSAQYGGPGGAGGAWGTKGVATYGGTYGPPPGGKPGNAIVLNHHVATFVGGNDTTHVKGKIN